MPGFSRRQFLAGAGTFAGVQLLAPVVTRAGAAFGATNADPATRTRRRLVVVFLSGGNDGLNTVVPTADVGGAARSSVYRKVRPTVGYSPSAVRALDRFGDAGQALGLNTKLGNLHRLYGQGRVAIVQGVDYPRHNYSHFTSQSIWHSGAPDRGPDSGWLGRHLDRAGIGTGELRAVGIGTQLPLMLTGARQQGSEVQSIPATRFIDGIGDDARPRHGALAAFASHPADEPVRRLAGQRAAAAVALADELAGMKAPKSQTGLAAGLLTARRLLEEDLGVETVFVPHRASYDTHANEKNLHERALSELDGAIEAFLFGTSGGKATGDGALRGDLADRTLILVISEFGRRLGENGAGGTDHGAAGPVFLIGPPAGTPGPALRPGLHGDHPDMGTAALPADDLAQTTDLRSVYRAVLESWLGDPDPWYAGLPPVPGLFG